MSPVIESLAQLLARSRRGVTANVNDNDRRQADAVLAEFLVVLRSDIVGTEYGARYSDPGWEPRTWISDDEADAIQEAERTNAEPVSRPVLPWTPIPLPEDGDSNDRP